VGTVSIGYSQPWHWKRITGLLVFLGMEDGCYQCGKGLPITAGAIAGNLIALALSHSQSKLTGYRLEV